MAGVTNNDSGTPISYQTVASIGGDAKIAQSAHVGDDNRADGVAYNENPGVDVTSHAYPTGTAFKDTTPGEPVN